MITLKGKIDSIEYSLEKSSKGKEYVEEKIDIGLSPKGFVYYRIPQQAEFQLGDEVIITIKKVK